MGNICPSIGLQEAVNGILTRVNPNIRIFDDESADFSQIFEDLAKYLDSSNPNRASGGSNIRFAVHCQEVLGGMRDQLRKAQFDVRCENQDLRE